VVLDYRNQQIEPRGSIFLINNYMKTVIFLILLIAGFNADAAVRWNPTTRIWEGNVCMNSVGWQIVNWQPVGSICMIQFPGRPPMQGIIINA